MQLRNKHKKYDSLATSLDQNFSALVMETYGGMHADFHHLIDSAVENARNNQQLHHQAAINLKVLDIAHWQQHFIVVTVFSLAECFRSQA